MPSHYRIVLSPRAGAELEAIFDYIAARSPHNASLVVGRILKVIGSLEFMPGRFKVERRSRKLGYDVYSTVVSPHVIYYRIVETDNVVRILTVRHGARRSPRDLE